MIHNFIWFAIPASNDILRAKYITYIVDAIGNIWPSSFFNTYLYYEKKKYTKDADKSTYHHDYSISVFLFYRLDILLYWSI